MQTPDRPGSREFRAGVFSLHREQFKALFCRICFDKIAFDFMGRPVRLQAHHTEPYCWTGSQDPLVGIVVGDLCHQQLHNGNGSLTRPGKKLLQAFKDAPGQELYDVGVDYACKIEEQFDINSLRVDR